MSQTLKRSLLIAGALAPLVAVSSAAHAALYWDGNGPALGAGSAPTGTWGSDSWWSADANGEAATVAWTAGEAAVFSAGANAAGPWTLAISGTQTASSVLFEEGTVNVSGGLSPGTIDTGTGTVTVGTGAGTSARVNFNSSTRFNTTGKVLLNGGVLVSTNSSSGLSFLSPTKAVEISAVGGSIGFDDSAVSIGSSLYSGTITGTGGTTSNGGVGTLTKIGPDEFRFQGAGVANSTFAKLVVLEGLYRIGAASTPTTGTAERGFGAVPTAFLADAITLNGGAIGTSITAAAGTLSAFRGITIGANGGTLNATAGSLVVPGAITGAGTLIVTGGNGITLGSASNATTFTGALQLDGGLTLSESFVATNLSGTVTTATVAIASAKTLTVGADGASTSYAGGLTGAGAFTKTGAGTLTINKDLANAGATNISGGTLRFGVSAAGLSATSTVSVAATATLDMNNVNDTFGSLGGLGSVINAGNLGVGGNNVSTNFGGTITRGTNAAGTLTKTGATSMFTISGSSNHAGTTAVNAGTLRLANSAGPALTDTAGVTITGILELAADDQINDAATITLSGGTLISYGRNEMTASSPGLGSLVLAANSIIDVAMTPNGSTLAFADSSLATWAGSSLKIYNWGDYPAPYPNAGYYIDHLYFGPNGLTADQIAKVTFYADGGTMSLGGATLLSNGELVPTSAVPEPTGIAIVGLGGVALLGRRRHA